MGGTSCVHGCFVLGMAAGRQSFRRDACMLGHTGGTGHRLAGSQVSVRALLATQAAKH